MYRDISLELLDLRSWAERHLLDQPDGGLEVNSAPRPRGGRPRLPTRGANVRRGRETLRQINTPIITTL